MTPADPPADRAPGAPGGETDRLQAALDFALEWPDLGLRGRLQAILNDEYDPAADPAYRPICGLVSNSGANGEPLACGYRRNHEGAHSWATLPTFTQPPAPPSADAGESLWVDVDGPRARFLARHRAEDAVSGIPFTHNARCEEVAYHSGFADGRLAAQQQHAAEVEQWRRESFAAAASLHAEIARLTADLQAAQQALARYRHPVEDMPEAARYGTTYPEWRAEKELQINGRLTKREGLLTASAWEVGESRMAQRLRAAVERVEADLQAAQQRADGLRELLRLYAIKTDHLADGWAMCLVCEGPAFSMGFPEQHKPECPLATPLTPTGDNRDGANQ